MHFDKCLNCNTDYTPSDKFPQYVMCTSCNSHLKQVNDSRDLNFYNNTYILDSRVGEGIKCDRFHYEQFKIELMKDERFCRIYESICRHIRYIHSYAGGFPKFEIGLNFEVENIHVYDWLASKYYDATHLLTDVYPEINFTKSLDGTNQVIIRDNIKDAYNINLHYKTSNITQMPFYLDEPCLITMAHILEHLTEKEIYPIFEQINDNLPLGSFGMIYQPNPGVAKNDNWVHFNHEDQHITFYSISRLKGLINGFSNLTVQFVLPYNDDLFILFSRV